MIASHRLFPFSLAIKSSYGPLTSTQINLINQSGAKYLGFLASVNMIKSTVYSTVVCEFLSKYNLERVNNIQTPSRRRRCIKWSATQARSARLRNANPNSVVSCSTSRFNTKDGHVNKKQLALCLTTLQIVSIISDFNDGSTSWIYVDSSRI